LVNANRPRIMEAVKPRADAQKPQGCNTLRLLARKNPLRVRLFRRAGFLTLALDYAVALVVRLGAIEGAGVEGKCRPSQSSIDFLSLAGMTLCHTNSLVCSL